MTREEHVSIKGGLVAVSAVLAFAALASCGGGGGGGAAPVSDVAALVETNDAGSVSGAQVAIDVHGNALAVWVQSDGTRNNIWANRYTAATGAWGVAALIETNDVSSAYRPQVALDANGNGLAAWDQGDGIRQNIWANRYTAATGAWGTAVLIETDNVGGATAPQLGFAANGNAVAVWTGNLSIWSNRYTAATNSWGTAAVIESGAGGAGSPQVAVAANGNAVAVWQQSDGTRDSIWANRLTAATGAWGVAALIETNDLGGAHGAQLAIDATGNATAAWVQSDGVRDNAWASRFTAGTTNAWGTAVLIETDDVGSADLPQVAVDAGGNALVVWQQDGDASAVVTNDIWSNRYTAGSGWGAAAPMETSAYRGAGPQVALNASGNGMAVWYQLDGTRQNVYARRYTAGTGWGAVALAESHDGGDSVLPQLAINDGGAIMAVWEQLPPGSSRHDLWADGF